MTFAQPAPEAEHGRPITIDDKNVAGPGVSCGSASDIFTEEAS